MNKERMAKDVLADKKTGRRKKCYLCGNTEFNKRTGSVRDRSELEIFECTSCGLVFLSSFKHIKDGFYESSKMHGEKMIDVQVWLKDTAWDDERRFQYLKSVLPNRKLIDFGCGAGGFLLSARELATVAHGVESESRLKSHFQNHGLTVFQNLSDIPNDICSVSHFLTSHIGVVICFYIQQKPYKCYLTR